MHLSLSLSHSLQPGCSISFLHQRCNLRPFSLYFHPSLSRWSNSRRFTLSLARPPPSLPLFQLLSLATQGGRWKAISGAILNSLTAALQPLRSPATQVHRPMVQGCLRNPSILLLVVLRRVHRHHHPKLLILVRSPLTQPRVVFAPLLLLLWPRTLRLQACLRQPPHRAMMESTTTAITTITTTTTTTTVTRR
ncbi:hypothetical protein BC835DRAFT_736176 [Cytidiella melzeri]|nr:hypothetical protein BC835DRAFT_736176 [Cytidiella melzeri]